MRSCFLKSHSLPLNAISKRKILSTENMVLRHRRIPSQIKPTLCVSQDQYQSNEQQKGRNTPSSSKTWSKLPQQSRPNSLKDKFCDSCDDIEDIAHFLYHCHRFSAQRHELNNELEAIYNLHNVAKEHRHYNKLILSDNNAISQAANSNILKAILQYIRNTKRF